MGKKKRRMPSPNHETPGEQAPPAGRRRRLWWAPTAALVVAAGLVVVFAASILFPGGGGGSSTDGGKPDKAMKAVAGDRAKPLVGRWLRPDGDYELHVESIASDGKVSARYLNPQPIKIAEATAGEKDGKLGLFVKLQDVGYPGSYYDLEYDAARDVLAGSYYQAVQGETYEIEFTRIKE